MNKKKVIIRVLLICLAVVIMWNWREMKTGFIKGFNEGYNSIPSK
jgi:hypothetical protein